MADSVGVVLVVDDDELVRELVVGILRAAGYVALPAGDAREADACATVYVVDLLLTDIALPDGSGLDLAAHLVARRPGLPVLFMTGAAEGVPMCEVMAGAQVDLLPKPFTPDELLRRVRVALSR